MTIYWEQCSLCGRYHSTRQCTLNPDVMVCVYCCISCPVRNKCPKPVWRFEFEKPVTPKPIPDEKKKLMEELLSKLEKT
ncbi:MAG: hypothetical protein B6U89_00010 [Desulfurococcales archaeon ex4484_58]|nr:MAG: hypothetical protein B6U89_00010 [Desulfurococcales archaeon ex4484_58]